MILDRNKSERCFGKSIADSTSQRDHYGEVFLFPGDFERSNRVMTRCFLATAVVKEFLQFKLVCDGDLRLMELHFA